MENSCVACGGHLEPGAIRARNAESGVLGLPELRMVVSAFAFVRPGVPTSGNPVKAFVQGLHEEPGEQWLSLAVFRCTGCGRIELYAPKG